MLIVARPAVMAASALALVALSGCDKLQPNNPAAEARVADKERILARKLQAACSSPTTYDRLKEVAFEEALRIHNANPANLDTLARYSIVQ